VDTIFKIDRLKLMFLITLAACLFSQSGCGLAKKFIRPFPKEKKILTGGKNKRGGLFSRKGKEPVAEAEGELKIIKRIEPERDLVQLPFSPEEKLIYGVKWRGIPIGEIRLMVDGLYQLNNGRRVYRLVYEASTNPLFDTVYKVRDQIVSYFDCQELIPWKTEKHLREGGYRRQEIIELDRENNQAIYLTSQPLEIAEIKPGAQDILSCFYYYRTKDIETGKSERMFVFSDRKNWNLELKALQKKRINTYLGKFDSILVAPEAKFRGVFFRKAKMQLYLKDDKSKIPLVITAKRSFFGSITATLMRMDKKEEEI